MNNLHISAFMPNFADGKRLLMYGGGCTPIGREMFHFLTPKRNAGDAATRSHSIASFYLRINVALYFLCLANFFFYAS